jgi:hypothetical protein
MTATLLWEDWHHMHTSEIAGKSSILLSTIKPQMLL